MGLIKQCWDVEKSAWQHRNSILHDTPLAEIMSGTLSLDRSPWSEWQLGFIGLPDIVKAMLPNSVEGTVAEKKRWFV